MEPQERAECIRRLQEQILKLYKATDSQNKYYWRAILNPGEHLAARPQYYEEGSKEAMQFALQYTYKAWAETPGSIDVMKAICTGKFPESEPKSSWFVFAIM